MSQFSGQVSRDFAASLLGERRGRSISQIVEDTSGVSKEAFHLLLIVAAGTLLVRSSNR